MTEWTVIAPADEAYYSLIEPVRMKGWVSIVGWPTADGLPILNGYPLAADPVQADQWKFAGQRPTFYHWATQPIYINGFNYLLKKLRDAGTTARQLAWTRNWTTSECAYSGNVDTVNDLVLSHKGALKCIKPCAKLQGRPAFITSRCTALFVRIFS